MVKRFCDFCNEEMKAFGYVISSAATGKSCNICEKCYNERFVKAIDDYILNGDKKEA